MQKSSDSRAALIEHLRRHALRTDGPFTLRSGAVSDWYLDGRQTTFDGEGARLVGRCIADMLPTTATAAGGMTMGADPIAVATAIMAERPLKSFSIRKEAKDHGISDTRIVGPVTPADRVVVLEDTTTTGGALSEAIGVLRDEGIPIVEAISLVDRSGGAVASRLADLEVAYRAVVVPEDLGVV